MEEELLKFDLVSEEYLTKPEPKQQITKTQSYNTERRKLGRAHVKKSDLNQSHQNMQPIFDLDPEEY